MFSYDIEACAKRIAPYIIRTPLVEVEDLSTCLERKVYLKLESMQRTGAFKFRGAMNYMLSLSKEEADRGVITASSGNHGLGMSLAGKLLGIRCTVVMPVSAPQTKQERAKNYGANLILHGQDYDEAQAHAQSLAQREGFTYVPSFNHPRIIEGQGTVLAEILEDLPNVDMVIAPVGGGGMIGGLLLGKEEMRATKVQMIGVEPTGAASMQYSMDQGHLSTLPTMQTIADGVAVRTPGSLNFEIVQHYRPTLWQVDDEAILNARRRLFQKSRVISEAAGAVTVAALLEKELPKEAKEIVCIISGSNLDLRDYDI